MTTVKKGDRNKITPSSSHRFSEGSMEDVCWVTGWLEICFAERERKTANVPCREIWFSVESCRKPVMIFRVKVSFCSLYFLSLCSKSKWRMPMRRETSTTSSSRRQKSRATSTRSTVSHMNTDVLIRLGFHGTTEVKCQPPSHSEQRLECSGAGAAERRWG